MKTDFPPELLADPAMRASEAVIRKCVHCGFCTATCPTYVLLGDELDSPRGRIYLMKDMLEGGQPPSPEVVKHIDRCLSCLSCMTTCPSGVNYMHLVDHARAYIEAHYRRPLLDRAFRALLAAVLPYPRRFRFALRLARLIGPSAPLIEKLPGLERVKALLALAPGKLPEPAPRPQPHIVGAKGRVAMLGGCVEPILKPGFQAAAIRVLERSGYAVVFAPGEVCCGALVHHMGREQAALASARRNVDAWTREIESAGLSAIIVTASGCGTTIKDYGFMLRDDPAYAEKAAHVSALAMDVSEFLAGVDLQPVEGYRPRVGYHAACSLQHGQKVTDAPKALLSKLGYTVATPVEAHLCCGSAGIYNIVQPRIAGQLGDRKAANLDRLDVDVIATGNIGCAMQIGQRSARPILHTIELVDWATGGPVPASIEALLPKVSQP